MRNSKKGQAIGDSDVLLFAFVLFMIFLVGWIHIKVKERSIPEIFRSRTESSIVIVR